MPDELPDEHDDIREILEDGAEKRHCYARWSMSDYDVMCGPDLVPVDVEPHVAAQMRADNARRIKELCDKTAARLVSMDQVPS